MYLLMYVSPVHIIRFTVVPFAAIAIWLHVEFEISIDLGVGVLQENEIINENTIPNNKILLGKLEITIIA